MRPPLIGERPSAVVRVSVVLGLLQWFNGILVGTDYPVIVVNRNARLGRPAVNRICRAPDALYIGFFKRDRGFFQFFRLVVIDHRHRQRLALAARRKSERPLRQVTAAIVTLGEGHVVFAVGGSAPDEESHRNIVRRVHWLIAKSRFRDCEFPVSARLAGDSVLSRRGN